MKLSTIQKNQNLNDVHVIGPKGNGGAFHQYAIIQSGDPYVELSTNGVMGAINFQNGARTLEDSVHGILDTDLLEIVRHRLQCFQAGEFATPYNHEALKHVELALMYSNRRVEDRIERSVLGTNNK